MVYSLIIYILKSKKLRTAALSNYQNMLAFWFNVLNCFLKFKADGGLLASLNLLLINVHLVHFSNVSCFGLCKCRQFCNHCVSLFGLRERRLRGPSRLSGSSSSSDSGSSSSSGSTSDSSDLLRLNTFSLLFYFLKTLYAVKVVSPETFYKKEKEKRQ